MVDDYTAVALASLLLLAKWVLIGLIYLILLVVLVAVRREMRQHLVALPPASSVAPGRLRVIQGGSDPRLQPGLVLPLPNRLVLGADADQLDRSDLAIRDQYVSGRHARLSWDGAAWWVEDLGSTNGTRINGQACPPHQPQGLAFGSTLQVGDAIFELVE